MASGSELAVGVVYSEKTPAGVRRPILDDALSVNHKLPEASATIWWGVLLAVGMANSVTTPAVVMRPILLAPASVNHRAPSAAVIQYGWLVLDRLYSVNVPLGVWSGIFSRSHEFIFPDSRSAIGSETPSALTRMAASWGQALTHAGTCPGCELHRSHTTARSVTSFSTYCAATASGTSGL